MNINTREVTVNNYPEPFDLFWYGFYFTLGCAVAACLIMAILIALNAVKL